MVLSPSWGCAGEVCSLRLLSCRVWRAGGSGEGAEPRVGAGCRWLRGPLREPMAPGTSSRAGGWLGSGPPTSGAEEKAPEVHRGCSRGFPVLSGQRSPAGLVSSLFFSAAGAGTPGLPASHSPSALSRLLSLSLPRFPGCARAVLESRSSRRSPLRPPCPRSAASAAGEGREPGAGQGPSSALTMQPGAPLPPLYLCSSSAPAVQKPRGGRERASLLLWGRGKERGESYTGWVCL